MKKTVHYEVFRRFPHSEYDSSWYQHEDLCDSEREANTTIWRDEEIFPDAEFRIVRVTREEVKPRKGAKR